MVGYVFFVCRISCNMYHKLVDVIWLLTDVQDIRYRANAFQNAIFQRQKLMKTDDSSRFCPPPVQNVAQGDINVEPIEL